MVYINVDSGSSYVNKPVPITNRFTGGDGTPVDFHRVISDSGSHWGGTAHPDVIAKGGSSGLLAHGVVALRLEDFTSGTEFQIWQIEYDSNWDIVEVDYSEEEYAPTEHDLLPRADPEHDRSVKHYRMPVFAWVNAGHYLAVRITQFHDSPTYTDAEGVERDFRIGVIAKAKATLEINPK